MKQYEYVNLKVGRVFSSKSEQHREIINKYAAMGYRYVGYIPTHLDSYGKMESMDLIFEKDKTEE